MGSDVDLTVLLGEWARGDRAALDRLTPLVYPELHALARAQLRRGSRCVTVQTTAVVSHLFVKLLSGQPPKVESRKHFFVLAARMMRLALVDQYRRNRAEKRGPSGRVPLHENLLWVNAVSEEMLAFDQALSDLEQLDPAQAELVGLRFLAGCSAEEAAEVTGVSKATVDRKIRLARAWLYQRLHESKDGAIADVEVEVENATIESARPVAPDPGNV
jgi:RNA polymerase sigma factor (TIGR02999 family)